MPDPESLPSLTAHQVAAAQIEMRAALGLEEERFPLPAFIGMVSDEIEQLRAQGYTDTDIAELIEAASRVAITAEDIGLHYASPEARGRPHE